MKKKEWFASWFDTPFYHILYQNRDFDEAEKFINQLLTFLNPPQESKILDLACGKGRHAYFMAKQNYLVEGADLSPESIEHAREHYKMDNLSFKVHDMREPYDSHDFNYVFNFFTSFGYFDSLEDNKRVIQAMEGALCSGGTLVIDFMNASRTIANLVNEEQKEMSGLVFNLERKHENGCIVKDIRFSYKEEDYHYQEKVQALTLHDFQSLIQGTQLKLEQVFGDYNLNEFDEMASKRLIMVLKKD